MAHIIVEYSENLDQKKSCRVDLLAQLSQAAVTTNFLPLAGIRARAYCSDAYRVGDGQVDGAFVHVEIRIGPGRDSSAQQHIAQSVFDALTKYFAHESQAIPLALSVELTVLGIRHNQNNLREYMSS